MVAEIWKGSFVIAQSISPQWMAMAIILLTIAIALSFMYDHWATVFIVSFATFLLMFFSICPYMDITDNAQNTLISGGTAVFLAGVRYHFIKSSMPEMFRDKSFGTVLIIMGIVVLLLLIFF